MTDTIPSVGSQVATASPLARSSTGTTEEATSATAITSDFETFLRMLTVQAENQDPLNPIDSSDFAVQLATFSGVEQQVLTNDLLKGLSGSLAGGELAELAGWVGMDARAAAPAVFDGNPIYVEASPQAGAARAEMKVYDQTGQVWDQFTIDTQPGPLIWDGVRADGTPFPDGVYTFSVSSFDGEGNELSSSVALTYNRVIEAQTGPEGARLLLGNGEYVAADAVSALRQAVPPV